MKSVLITGDIGFIGQNLVHARRRARPDDWLIIVDTLSYATDLHSPGDVTNGAYNAWINKNYSFRIAV